jgi:hypothetical protein
MNLRTGICIFVIILLFFFVLAWVSAGRGKEDTTEEITFETESVSETETSVYTISEEQPIYEYIVRESDGQIVVYEGDGETVYMETGIHISQLSESMERQLEAGIGFSDEESLFAFLENYAS